MPPLFHFLLPADLQNRKDALRSLIISQRLIGTREIAVFHHTGCGMVTFTTTQLRDIVRSSNATSEQIESIDFHEFPDVEAAVKSDVEWLKKEPLILQETVITGWVYEVETGKVGLLLSGIKRTELTCVLKCRYARLYEWVIILRLYDIDETEEHIRRSHRSVEICA
jgi:hypothetical protein